LLFVAIVDPSNRSTYFVKGTSAGSFIFGLGSIVKQTVFYAITKSGRENSKTSAFFIVNSFYYRQI
tara:strand:- start:96 stop:293 length:198 start_codon:yes stop_codon:yes gene_type:complete